MTKRRSTTPLMHYRKRELCALVGKLTKDRDCYRAALADERALRSKWNMKIHALALAIVTEAAHE